MIILGPGYSRLGRISPDFINELYGEPQGTKGHDALRQSLE